jgi:hypothetical protein
MSDEAPPRDSNCAGFYHWPPIWIGANTDKIDAACSADPNTEVFASTMSCGVKAKVSPKGVFVFDFRNWPLGVATSTAEWEAPVLARMRFMNLWLTCFYSAEFRITRTTMEKMFIDLSSYAFARELDLNPYRFGCDVRQAAVIHENEKQHQQRRPWHTLVTLDVLSDAFKLTDTALADEANDAATLGELLLHAFELHDSGKCEASHISAWTVAERCLNQMWRSHLDDAETRFSTSIGDPDEKFINSTRMQKLTGRDFTASIVSEILSLNGLLPFEQYKLTVNVRQTRNDWLHKLRSINRDDSAKAINLARFMLQHSGVLDVEIPFHVIGSVPIAYVSQ